jgi:hypothetical protein
MGRVHGGLPHTMVAMTSFSTSSTSGNGGLRSGKVGGARWCRRMPSRSGYLTASLHLFFLFFQPIVRDASNVSSVCVSCLDCNAGCGIRDAHCALRFAIIRVSIEPFSSSGYRCLTMPLGGCGGQTQLLGSLWSDGEASCEFYEGPNKSTRGVLNGSQIKFFIRN